MDTLDTSLDTYITNDTLDTKDSKWRNKSNARYLKALFLETNFNNPSVILYTLKDEEYKGYPSLRKLYLEKGDPTEYSFADSYFENWDHWKMICDCEWFKPYVQAWREELEIKLRSAALSHIIKEAKSGSRNSYNANKIILDGGWKPKSSSSSSKGRPKKQETEAEARAEAERKAKIKADYERMNNNGGT